MQVIVDEPELVRGLAVVAHPHPLFGGANNNKVVYTLAHALRDLGYVALRPNFRGVGRSAGVHDQGCGETQDILAALAYAGKRWDEAHALPVVLAGFSFGAFVQAQVSAHLSEAGRGPARLVLVGLATGEIQHTRVYDPPAVPADTLLIHGERDEVVPLANVLTYAAAHDLAVTVVPGADHFFHGRLPLIRRLVVLSLDTGASAARELGHRVSG